MREIIRPGLILFLVTAVAAACLGTVYGVTKEPIAQQKILTRNAALQELLPEADDFEESGSIPPGSGVAAYFTGVSGGEIAGYVINVTPTGYDGTIDMLVGLDKEGVILGVNIVSHTETPGLGANAKEPEFIGQFTGKQGQLKVTKSNAEGEIQAITSATITSVAVVEGVNAASEFFENNLRGAK